MSDATLARLAQLESIVASLKLERSSLENEVARLKRLISDTKKDVVYETENEVRYRYMTAPVPKSKRSKGTDARSPRTMEVREVLNPSADRKPKRSKR